MSESFLFDKDALTRTVEIFHYDEADNKFWIESRQDITDIIEQNKRDYNDATRYRLPVLGDKGLGRRVANVPMTIIGQWWIERRNKQMSHDEWQKFLADKLNDPDNKFFRTDGTHL